MSEKTDRVDYAIDIVGLSKRFRRRTLGPSGYTTLKSSLLRGFGLFGNSGAGNDRIVASNRNGSMNDHYTTVLSDLTMRIPKGASVGVIGRNGSGKSSFLKLLTGIYQPDSGTISVNGRLAALIELGAGFHPDFSGRENIILGGIMYGLSRPQIESRVAEIAHFAELTEVLDDPVRTYSSGMFMRLGFSLAIHTYPDILLVDEVLAVGDAAFTSKCKDQLSQLRRDGKTLVLVSHDMDAIARWSDEVLWLHGGIVRDRGEPRRVIDHYLEHIERGEESELFQLSETTDKADQSVPQNHVAPSFESQRWGSREIEITGVRLFDRDGEPRRLFHPESELRVEIDYVVNDSNISADGEAVFGIGINRSDGVIVHGTNTDIERVNIPALGRAGTVHYVIQRIGVLDGSYALDVAVHRSDGYPFDYLKNAVQFAVRWHQKQVGVFLPQHEWRFDSHG